MGTLVRAKSAHFAGMIRVHKRGMTHVGRGRGRKGLARCACCGVLAACMLMTFSDFQGCVSVKTQGRSEDRPAREKDAGPPFGLNEGLWEEPVKPG